MSHLDAVRELVLEHARLGAEPSAVDADTDLYSAGLSSLTTVHLMLALEDHFDVEFPERLLARQTFESVRSIAEAVEELLD